jgi:enamine deaminase RidA (YjgF/YER057c/UK114 family)
MSDRVLITSGVPWESVVGYSRAVRTGAHVFVSGTTATLPDGSVGGLNDEYEQARLALANVKIALEQAGAKMSHVVRTRMFVTNIANWQAIGRAHGEVFGDIRPATSMLQVAALIDPAMLIEIEADAVIDD